MKLIVRLTVLITLSLFFAACGSSNNSGALGAITVNGPGLDGSVPAGTSRLFTLQSIVKDQTYTLRTEIPLMLLPDGTQAVDGTLTVFVYSSEDAFKNNLPALPVSVVPSTRFPSVYEGNFTAATSGDYVAAVSGTSLTIKDTQFFYNLRIMSADPASLTSFVTPTILASNSTAYPGVLAIYNGGNVTSSGTYSIRLTSSSTSTIGYPQLFVYSNNTLKTDSLLYSSVSNSMNFNITSFLTPTDQGVTTLSPADVISGVTLTSGSDGPYIMVKGVASMPFSLSIEP
jgi:hypothetical protein